MSNFSLPTFAGLVKSWALKEGLKVHQPADLKSWHVPLAVSGVY